MTGDRVLRLVAGALALAGIGLRLAGLGRHGLQSDEAAFAIVSRADGLDQFLLALGPTPIAWGASLRPLLALPVPPETALRLLPAAAGVATLWLAWRLGGRLAGHRAGGLLALGLVALDPGGIAWAQSVRPYTTEAALALLTFLVAGRSAPLALMLVPGVLLSNAQLLLVAPLFLALAARRDRRGLKRLAGAGALVGLWSLTWFALVVHPRFTPALRQHWDAVHPPLHEAVARALDPSLGAAGIGLAIGGLAVLLCTRDGRWAAIAILLLALELAGLARLRAWPFPDPGATLFFSTLVLVAAGAGAGRLAAALWSRPILRPAVVAAGVVATAAIAIERHGGHAARGPTEDLGPLLERLERERRSGDRILLYEPSLFAWGFYRTGSPRLIAAPESATGAAVVPDDPELATVSGRDADAAVARAFDGAPRVWFAGSLLRPGDEDRIWRALLRHGRLVRSERRDGAVLLLLAPR